MKSASLDAPPKGLSGSDWASIREAYEAGRHAIQRRPDGTLAAPNPGQRWVTEFDGRGFLTRPDGGGWEWGLELRSVNGRQTEAPVQEAESGAGNAEGNRLRYDRGGGLEEWFVNDRRGLEQGWTFAGPPRDGGPDGAADADGARIRLDLAVRGGLAPAVTGAGLSVAFRDGATTVLTYGGLKAWDAVGKPLPVRFVEGEAANQQIAIEVDVAGASYPVTIDPVAQQAYLKASNTDAGDRFGTSVAISGDTVVVGANGEGSAATGIDGDQANNSADWAGAVYVFFRSGVTWTQQAYLKASNTDLEDNFGYSVAIFGDTVVVGAPGEDSASTGTDGDQTDNNLQEAGAAYLFVRSGSTWTQHAYLKASNTDAGDSFGGSVAISGDTVVVGATGEDSAATGIDGDQFENSAEDSGAAYVFTRSGVSWTQHAYLKASNTEASDGFGESVAISGDTVVVGTGWEDSAATGVDGDQSDNSAKYSGAAYIFSRSDGDWTQQAYLKASNTDAGDRFGRSVAISGDTAVIGAPSESSATLGIDGDQSDNNLENAGAAYLFVRSGSTWIQQSYLKASNTGWSDLFGESVAISGDTVVVGAGWEDSAAIGVDGDQSDNSAGNSGAAYIFTRSGANWTQKAYLKASNTSFRDGEFGRSVAISGDTAVIGAPQESSAATGIDGDQGDNSSLHSGAAYLFTIEPEPDPTPVLHSLSKTGASAPGGIDLAYTTASFVAVDVGDATFEQGLTGSGAPRGRNRAIYHWDASSSGLPTQVLQAGAPLTDVHGSWDDQWVGRVHSPLANASAFGRLFQVTAAGPRTNKFNNQALLRDDGTQVSLVRRTGWPHPELGGADSCAFYEALEAHGGDLVVVPHKLRPLAAAGVTKLNDSGLLAVSHTGAALGIAAPPREGDPDYNGDGTLGQFAPRAAVRDADQPIFFTAAHLPQGGGKPVAGLYAFDLAGQTTGRLIQQGDVAGGAGTATFRTFLGIAHGETDALFRSTLTGAPKSGNEGLWYSDHLPAMLKGEICDPVYLPGLTVARIVRFWPVGQRQVVIQVILAGPGVTRANNTALILHQEDRERFPLLRTGEMAPGITDISITLAAIQAVDVNPVSGHYAVIGSLRGASKTTNQALWSGQTTLGSDTSVAGQEARLPRLRLRKGDTYTTEQTPMDLIRGLALKPAPDPTGAGGRGLAQAVGAGGHIGLCLLGDRKLQEWVVLEP
ncbi:MAG: FG-GAP repeat protein [Verrucomicrobiales bacterium]|nr:FG-GAP repeat protein [Verrucomicrobiales bacterium]